MFSTRTSFAITGKYSLVWFVILLEVTELCAVQFFLVVFIMWFQYHVQFRKHSIPDRFSWISTYRYGFIRSHCQLYWTQLHRLRHFYMPKDAKLQLFFLSLINSTVDSSKQNFNVIHSKKKLILFWQTDDEQHCWSTQPKAHRSFFVFLPFCFCRYVNILCASIFLCFIWVWYAQQCKCCWNHEKFQQTTMDTSLND